MHVFVLPIATLPCNESCDCTFGDTDMFSRVNLVLKKWCSRIRWREKRVKKKKRLVRESGKYQAGSTFFIGSIVLCITVVHIHTHFPEKPLSGAILHCKVWGNIRFSSIPRFCRNHTHTHTHAHTPLVRKKKKSLLYRT